MSDETRPNDTEIKANRDEANLLRILRNNPIMAQQIQAIATRFEQEVSDGMDAHEAEASLITSLQQLGISMMGQWAHNTQEKALEKSLQEDPSLHKHSKKNSSGTPPSAS